MPALGQIAERIVGDLEASSGEEMVVVEVTSRVGENAEGERALYFDVAVAPPREGRETWPVEDVIALQRALVRAARDAELEIPAYVAIRSAEEDEQEAESVPINAA